MTESVRPRPLTAVGLLLVGAGLSAYLANPPGGEVGFSGDAILALVAAVFQLGVAGALWLGLSGAGHRVAVALTAVAFVGHWLVLGAVGLLLLLFVVFPPDSGPLGRPSDPLILVPLALFGLGAALIYGTASRELAAGRAEGSRQAG